MGDSLRGLRTLARQASKGVIPTRNRIAMPIISGARTAFPNSADVVIVGGGVIGCATAFFLAKAGPAPLVLERDQLGCEASGEAAGMLAPQAEADQPGPFFEFGPAGRRPVFSPAGG